MDKGYHVRPLHRGLTTYKDPCPVHLPENTYSSSDDDVMTALPPLGGRGHCGSGSVRPLSRFTRHPILGFTTRTYRQQRNCEDFFGSRPVTLESQFSIHP